MSSKFDNFIESYYSTRYSFIDCFQIYDYIAPPPPKTIENINSACNICMVGTLSNGKGQLELLRAIKIIENEGYYGKFSISFAGEGPFKKEIEKFSEENLKTKVDMRGQVSDIYSYYSNQDVIVACSSREALGRVVAEGFYMKKILVTSDRGEFIYLIPSRGLMYKYGEIDSLAKLLEKIIDKVEALNIDFEDNYQYAIEQFAGEKYTKIIDKLEKWSRQ